jgi:hypothetical protein
MFQARFYRASVVRHTCRARPATTRPPKLRRRKLTIKPSRGDLGLRVDGSTAADDATAAPACSLSRTFRKRAVRRGRTVAVTPRASFRSGAVRRAAAPAMVGAGRTASSDRERDSAGVSHPPMHPPVRAVVAGVEPCPAGMTLRRCDANIQCQQCRRDHRQADGVS